MPSIGKYEILEQLGSGSMGTVHRAHDKLLDRMVALKMIRTGVNIELEAKERFYREARTCARLSHPHIVSVYDLGEENGVSFIAMELLKGNDFRQLIERKEHLPLPVKLIAMAQICEGLAHAHREGVIHRDIKPSNLFLLADGRAKIVDFGIAKLPMSHLTRSGAVLGTPNYMAPEQIQGLPCDGRADLFSAGIVFFEFLSYRHPFQGALIPQRILEDKADSLFQCDPSLPRILERVFNRALAKLPADRYATGDEFAADLRTVVDALALNASPTFSSVELPSASSFAVPPPIPLTESGPARHVAGFAPPQPGSGTGTGGDWRTARIQQLLPILDGQIAHRDIVGARSSLAELQSVVGVDSRFRDALEHYRARVAALDSPLPPPPGTPSGTGTGTQIPAPPPPPVASPGAPPVASQKKLEPTASVPANPGRPGDKKRMIIVGAIVAVAIAALLIVPGFFRTVKQEPFVASARITSQEGVLHENASANGKIVAHAQRGTLVHVLEMPQSLTTGFVRVQARDGDSYTRAGYIQTSDLVEWDSKDPKVALAMARLSGPMESGSDADLLAQIDRLNSVAATFPGKPEAAAAGLDAAKLGFELAKRSKDANPTSTDWQTKLADLSNRLEPLRSEPSVQGGVDELLKRIHELMGNAPPLVVKPRDVKPPENIPGGVTPPQPPPGPDDIKTLLQTADRLRRSYRYNDAKAIVQRVLKIDPANADAKNLLNKINAAIELERTAQ